MGADSILRDLVTAELARSGEAGWSVEAADFWCRVTPDGYPMPEQGWKLHVSATMLSAPFVLAQVARVLIEAGCAFKFPAELGDYWELLSPHCARAQAGKFVTVYPADDAESVRLAALLDEATRGLPGPVILSDRPYRAGGIVHYRYGAFSGHRTLGNDGFYEVRLRAPGGELVRDQRTAAFTPPSFADSPFQPLARPSKASVVMLNDRFVVREAIRHANRGGVYLAEDTKTGREVIVKEGRPHASSDLGGRDARDRLAAERAALDDLAATDGVPAVVDYFEQGGHAFLAEELVPGLTAHRWSEAHATPLGPDGFGCAVEKVVPVVSRLVALLREVHRHGYVFRDLSPGNVMILPDGQVRLVDLEYAAKQGTTVMVGGTPGYLAPELAPHTGAFRQAPPETADLYSLGALAYFLAVGADLGLAEDLADDEVAGPAWGPRAADHLARVAESNPTLAALRPMVAGLLAEPDNRWTLDACTRFLTELEQTKRAQLELEQPGAPRAPQPRVTANDLVSDGLAWLAETMDDRPDCPSPWPNITYGLEADPCSVSAGAAGMLMVLPPEQAGAVSRWLRRRLAEEDVWPPGLYAGRSGALWALYEAAEDEESRDFAVRAAYRLPTDHPSPDVTHGLAGCAMATLRLAIRADDPALRERATEILQNLHDARSSYEGRPQWQTRAAFDSSLAGTNHFGFAHGLAGVGTALLYGGVALGRADWMETVREVAHTFYEHADVEGDTAWWPFRRDERESVRPRRPHWCSGSSGVGSFLIRYWNATNDPAALELAEKAAIAAHRTRWQSGSVLCHGLPGEGDFLLDMARFTGDERYHRWAEDLAGCLCARAVRHAGRLHVPDRLGRTVPTYLGGTAGVLAFLLRLRHGHPRLWMLDDVIGRSP
ncbi:class IV lanthionine synthetase LanL [Nonomuraea guangzhouensis]|uniref:non-specific serine/threonine protein kinase n=1 Tax=Nonomuraea guangzhouensis TaxID=1291555 RepID=A0ABW4GW86_9ACTN|nr:class IV lanthionine synthetase LanL [Nonomuraea guangzhouensis]